MLLALTQTAARGRRKKNPRLKSCQKLIECYFTEQDSSRTLHFETTHSRINANQLHHFHKIALSEKALCKQL